MADITDVTAYLATAATAAVYPSGTSQPSVAAMDVMVLEGWPNAAKLDLDLSGQMLVNGVKTPRPGGILCNVSVFPMLGQNTTPYQILDETYTIVAPSYGLSLAVAGTTITFSGTPHAGEYVSIIADGSFGYSETGATATAIINALAADFSANYTGVSSTSTTLTIPFVHSMTVRQGGSGTIGKVTHRQKQAIMVTVWAPNTAVRKTLAAAIDNYIKQSIRIMLPDTSQAIVCYNRTNIYDAQQMAGIYRRDLIYDVEYATVTEYTAFVVTIVDSQITVAGPLGNASPIITLT